MILDPNYKKRTLDEVRRFVGDIAECDKATVDLLFEGGRPIVKFVFDIPTKYGKPSFGVALVAESKSRPLEGRLLEGDELRRHVRSSVEQYLKLNGINISTKAILNASL